MEPKAELRRIIGELTDFILDLAPDASVEYEPVIYEDEHANLSVYPPLAWSEQQCALLQDRIGDRVSDLHIDTGYLILTYVVTPEQQVAEAQSELRNAQKEAQKAERVLAEARSLGLYQIAPDESRLVPA